MKLHPDSKKGLIASAIGLALVGFYLVGSRDSQPAATASPVAQTAEVGDRVYFSENTTACSTFAVFAYEAYAEKRSQLCVRIKAKTYGTVVDAHNFVGPDWKETFYLIDTPDYGPKWLNGPKDFTVTTKGAKQKI